MLSPQSETVVYEVTNVSGTHILESRNQLCEKKLVALSNGFCDVHAKRPFAIRMATFATTPQTLVKNQIWGTAMPSPTTVYAVELSDPNEEQSVDPSPSEEGTRLGAALSRADSPPGVHQGTSHADLPPGG